MDDMKKKLYKIWICVSEVLQNTAMLIGLCIVCDRLNSWETLKPKIFIIWTFTEKLADPQARTRNDNLCGNSS